MNEKLERYIMTDSDGNDEINRELARLGPQYVDEIITLLLKLIRNLPEGIGSGAGMSPMQRVLTYAATDKAWHIINTMGWAGVQALIYAIDSDNRTRGIVACLILCEEENPNQKIVEELYNRKRFIEFNNDPTRVERATVLLGNLVARALSLSGDTQVRKSVENLCQQRGARYEDWLQGIVENAICHVRDS